MARFTEWTPALERALAEPFPKELVQQKRKGGSSIDFVARSRCLNVASTGSVI